MVQTGNVGDSLVRQHGLPQAIVTDKGTPFVSTDVVDPAEDPARISRA